MYDLKKVIEANTNEGVIDVEKVMESIDNEYVNPIVAKKTDKTKLMPEVTATMIKELGIEGESIDDIKLYIKKMGGSTDEIKEANLTLEKRFKELEEKYKGEVETRATLEKEATNKYQTELVQSLGIEDKSQVEYFKWKFNNEVTEEKDFKTLVEEYAKDNNVKTTNRVIKDPFSNKSNETDIAEIWREKRKLRRK